MKSDNSLTSEPSITESIDKLFLSFLIGKNHVFTEDEDCNDWLDNDLRNSRIKATKERPNGRSQRILLDVEKERVKREKNVQSIKNKRDALLTRYFQQLLLKTVNDKLESIQTTATQKLQFKACTAELLEKLLADDTATYPVIGELLDPHVSVRNRLIALVYSKDFMHQIDRESRIVNDVESVVQLVGIDVLRFVIPPLLFKGQINPYSEHNVLFAKKLWRYKITLGQTCSALMLDSEYERPYEGMLLSAMVNFGYAASYQQYITSFEEVRLACLDHAREQLEKNRHDFFFNLQTDSASLQALLASKEDLQLSLMLSESVFRDDFPHLVDALKEEVERVEFEQRTPVGKILYKAIRFAKYDQLRSSRLFKESWVDTYLQDAQIEHETYRNLLRQELFRFKLVW